MITRKWDLEYTGICLFVVMKSHRIVLLFSEYLYKNKTSLTCCCRSGIIPKGSYIFSVFYIILHTQLNALLRGSHTIFDRFVISFRVWICNTCFSLIPLIFKIIFISKYSSSLTNRWYKNSGDWVHIHLHK